MKTGHWHSGFRCRVSGFRPALTFLLLTPETRHLKPMLRESFTTPEKKRPNFLAFYEIYNLTQIRSICFGAPFNLLLRHLNYSLSLAKCRTVCTKIRFKRKHFRHTTRWHFLSMLKGGIGSAIYRHLLGLLS
jgi:hypothetical protein